MNSSILFSALLLTCTSTVSAQQTDWELKKSGEFIQVFTRTVPGSNIREFKAKAIVEAPLEDIVDFFHHTEKHPEWMEGISTVQTYHTAGQYLHYTLKMPFPLTDRYTVVSQIPDISGMPSQYVLQIENADDVPVESDLVKMPLVRGFWRFTALSADRTAVTQQFLSDPGSSIPDWIINLFIVKNPYKTLSKLKSLTEAGRS